MDLHRLIALDEFPQNERQLLARMLENALHLFQIHRNGSKFDKLLLVLHFAYRGIFDQRLYNDGLFLCDGLFMPDDNLSSNLMKIKKSILFGGFPQERKIIKLIDGLNKINGRDYLRLTQDDLNSLQTWLDYRPLSSADFDYSAIPSIICQVFNQPIDMTCDPTNFVVRTSILPFTEMIDYVFCTDSNNNLVPLPEEFKIANNVNSQCRRIPEAVKQLYNWHVLSILQRTRLSIISESMIDRRFTLFKHISDLGYKIHLFDVSTNRNGQVEVTPTMDDFKQFCIHNLH